MFNFSARGRRMGRIAFGTLLLAGAGILAHRLWVAEEPRAALVISGSWAAALAAYVIAGWLGSRRPLEHGGELAVPALVVPSIGVALLLPLTLHLPFALALMHSPRSFDEWVVLSGIITGPTHLALAALVAWRARQLARGAKAITPIVIFVVCVCVSCVPFGIYVLPPFLVAITGIPIVVLISLMEPLAASDRERAATEVLPHAIVLRRT